LIQKEVAEKIVHNAPKKSFLRWCINYAYKVEYCFSVPPQAFTPPPKVMSAVIRLIPKSPDQIPLLSYDDMLIFLDQYSPFNRKTLGASLKIVNKLSVKSQKSRVKKFEISSFAHQRLEELGWDEM
jgi:16S rRNA (adenine1518-N6/adenine1519-N6)-dimethyltransferase